MIAAAVKTKAAVAAVEAAVSERSLWRLIEDPALAGRYRENLSVRIFL